MAGRWPHQAENGRDASPGMEIDDCLELLVWHVSNMDVVRIKENERNLDVILNDY